MIIPTKLLRIATFGLAIATAMPAFSQQDAPKAPTPSAPAIVLTKFDLDFPGGTPSDLVTAIQKAMGRPINVIIPTQYAAIAIPALMMRQVDAAQLFRGLSESSFTNKLSNNANFPGQTYQTNYNIRTDGGKTTDDSVWYLTASMPPELEKAPRAVQFFLMTPYLDEGLTVDDITTAIQTGWKMADNLAGAELSYHKETKLLIVVGNNLQIQTVNEALRALSPKPKVAAASSAEKPAETAKSEK